MPLLNLLWITLIILLFKDYGQIQSFIYINLSPFLRLVTIAQGSVERAGTIVVVSFVMIVPVTMFVLSQSQILETFQLRNEIEEKMKILILFVSILLPFL